MAFHCQSAQIKLSTLYLEMVAIYRGCHYAARVLRERRAPSVCHRPQRTRAQSSCLFSRTPTAVI